MYSPLLQFFTINRSSRHRVMRYGFTFLVFNLACLTFSPVIQALLPPPPPDGGYLNFNTAEVDNALFNLTTGSGNTANGNNALFNNTTGSSNMANGVQALYSNKTGFYNTATGVNALFSNVTGEGNTANWACWSPRPGSKRQSSQWIKQVKPSSLSSR